MLQDGTAALPARPGQPTRDQRLTGCCGSRAGRQGKAAVCQMQHVVGGGSRNTHPRFSLMKPEPSRSARCGAGKPVSHPHIQVWLFLDAIGQVMFTEEVKMEQNT